MNENEIIRNVANEYISKKYNVDAKNFRVKFSASHTMATIVKAERLLQRNPKQLPSIKGIEGDDVEVFGKIVGKMDRYGY